MELKKILHIRLRSAVEMGITDAWDSAPLFITTEESAGVYSWSSVIMFMLERRRVE